MLSSPLEVNVIVINHSKYFSLLRKVSEATIGLERETAEAFATPQTNKRDHSEAQTLDQRQKNRELAPIDQLRNNVPLPILILIPPITKTYFVPSFFLSC